jgi:molybdopterin molybdotransferase
MVLTPINVGTAATAGAGRVTVYRRPTVALLATGEELVEIDQTPTGAQIRNANQYLLEGLVRAAHAEPVVLGVAPDNKDAIRRKIDQGLTCDILCTTGGASVGPFDFVPRVLEELGATFHIRKIATKPGRPTHFATAPNGTLIFALPGNPMSALVGFQLLVKPALGGLEGRPGAFPSPIRAKLCGSMSGTGGRQAYHPARARVTEDGCWEVEPLSWHGSGDLISAAGANALIMRPPQSAGAASGDTVSIYLL